jgi:hypothetical protein
MSYPDNVKELPDYTVTSQKTTVWDVFPVSFPVLEYLLNTQETEWH